jgi:hypothetical protein
MVALAPPPGEGGGAPGTPGVGAGALPGPALEPFEAAGIAEPAAELDAACLGVGDPEFVAVPAAAVVALATPAAFELAAGVEATPGDTEAEASGDAAAVAFAGVSNVAAALGAFVSGACPAAWASSFSLRLEPHPAATNTAQSMAAATPPRLFRNLLIVKSPL